MTVTLEQKDVCDRYRAKPMEPAEEATLGVAMPLSLGAPVHGQRYPPDGAESGWYLWTGAGVLADGEFRDLTMAEVLAAEPRVAKYLALPPGWRFTITADREQVWFDPSLFETSDNDA